MQYHKKGILLKSFNFTTNKNNWLKKEAVPKEIETAQIRKMYFFNVFL